jgi:hypothetical protein
MASAASADTTQRGKRGKPHRRQASQVFLSRRGSVAKALDPRVRRNRDDLVKRGVVVELSAEERMIRELEAEVSALKGELEQQASNHSRDQRDMIARAEMTAQEANLEFASQARAIHQSRERHLKEKKDLEGKLTRALLDQIKKRSGEFYVKVSKALKATMADEAVVRERELEQQLAELEDTMRGADADHAREKEAQRAALRADFELEQAAARDAFQQRLDGRCAELQAKHDEQLRALREDNSRKHSLDLDKIQSEWSKRWSNREREFLDQEAKREAQRQQELEAARNDHKRKEAEMARRHAEDLKERDRRDMAMLQQKLDELGRAREELDRDRAAYEKESAEKYAKALGQAKEQDRVSRAETDKLRAREVEALEQSITEERRMYIDAREKMVTAHEREIAALRVLIEDERSRGREKANRFENELERKFEVLAEGVEQQAREYHKHRLERSLGDLEHRAMTEVDKARVRNDAMLEAEQRMNSRFQRMVSELRESWNQEEQARALAADGRLRAHFETVLEHAQEQLQMALSLNDSVDKRWMEDVQRRNKQMLDSMKQFQAKCQRLYETRLKDYVAATEEQLRRYEAQLLEKGAAAAAEKGALRSKIRRIKIACQRWRVDYQRMIEARYEETVSAVEERYLAEIQALQAELVTLREKQSTAKLELNQQSRADSDVRAAEVLRQREQELENGQKERERQRNTDALRQMREQVRFRATIFFLCSFSFFLFLHGFFLFLCFPAA